MTDPVPRVGFIAWIENHMSYKAKLLTLAIVLLIIVGGGILAVNYLLDLRNELQNEKAARATLEQKFTATGNSAVTGNSKAPQRDLTAQAKSSFDPALMNFMAEQKAQIMQLSTGLARIESRVSAMGDISPGTLSQHQDAGTGALTGLPLDETRRDASGALLPPLTRVTLFYKPTERDPKLAFQGTTWTHKREDFVMAAGDWKKKEDGGFKTSLSLKRTVYDQDPTDPAHWIPIGSESIPLVSGDTVYSPAGLTPAPKQIPRWTAMVGAGKSGNSYRPAALVDYRLTDKWGLFAGAVSSGQTTGSNSAQIVGGISIRIGGNKP